MKLTYNVTKLNHSLALCSSLSSRCLRLGIYRLFGIGTPQHVVMLIIIISWMMMMETVCGCRDELLLFAVPDREYKKNLTVTNPSYHMLVFTNLTSYIQVTGFILTAYFFISTKTNGNKVKL